MRLLRSAVRLVLAGLLSGAVCCAQYVTLTGALQGSNGTPASNFAVNFTPTQMFFIAGTGVVVNSGNACATSTDGSVVGVGNPLSSTIVSAVYTGTLPAGNYYVKYTFYGSGGETLPSPEMVQQLTASGGLSVVPPVSGVPSTATGMRVYIGTASGAETLQGSTTGTASFAQSTALTAGAALPSSNSTVCKQVANDAGWPTGTGYVVSLTDTSGNVLPGYPMTWQLMGPGTTVNLSYGLPYYHGVVYFPSPILASPINHATQSISGPLSLTGYDLLNVGAIGVGTSLPAWPIDVENGFINSNLGYLVNGAAGTVGQCLMSGGASGPDVWGSCALLYQTVEEVGTPLTQRPVLNFDGTVVASDSASPARTNVGLPAKGTAGTYAQPTSITTDAQGRVTAVTSGGSTTPVNRMCPVSVAAGCYRVYADGTVEEWGVSTGCGSGSNVDCSVGVTLPYAMPTSLDTVVATATSGNSGASEGNVITMVYSPSTTGFTVRFGAMVYVSGGGNALDASVKAYWRAVGH